MRVTANRERCIGAGKCVEAAGSVFDQDEVHGRVLLLVDRPGNGQEEAVLDAVSSCPVGAVSVTEGRDAGVPTS
jgi:ferredoxin